MLTVAVLGPVDVRLDGVPRAIPAGKTTEVLVRLAVDAGTLVRTDRLIEDLWSAHAYGVARNTLQAKVSKLRRALGDPALVGGGPAGYTLHVEPAAVDLLEAVRLAGAGPTAAAAGLALFRGDLPVDGDWLAPHKARLQDARLRLTETQLGVRLDRGAGAELIGELEAQVAASPLREELWRLLITALYRAGRQADALAAYARVRERLADDLGLDPGPGLQDLERRILVQDRALTPRGNLPAPGSRLIGRAAELAALAELSEHRLVTVIGPAGVGKTRLALAAAATDESRLVRLDTGGPLWPLIGEAFGLAEATAAMVLDRLRAPGLRLLLDNCEHLVDELAGPVTRMLAAAPGLRILATSQLPLGLDGETTFALAPLSVADSVELFHDRAVRPATGGDVAGLCRALDGLPLAIELAAARTRVLSVAEIALRLDDRFALLSDPTSRRPPRRRALRAALAWSYDLLFPDDQRGLWALASFAGGATLPATEHVLGALGVPAAAAVDVVTRLADRSLLVVGDDLRYRLLDSIRAFGSEALRESGEEQTALAAHAAWFAAAATRAAHGLRGPDQAVHLSTVRTERSDIDAALAWAAAHDPLLGLRIANGFGWAWVFLGAGRDAAERHRSALSAAGPAAPTADRVDGLLFAGWFEASGGDLDRAVADVQSALALADTDELRARARIFLAFVHSQGGRPHEALAALESPRPADAWEAGAAWLLSAWAHTALGETGPAAQSCREALRLLVPIGDGWALAHAEALLGGLAQAEQRLADAAEHLDRAATATDRLGFAAAGALHRANLGSVQHQRGDLDTAAATLEQAIAAAQAAGDLRIVALARTRLAGVLHTAGRDDEARGHVVAAREWFATAGGGDGADLAGQLAAELGTARA